MSHARAPLVKTRSTGTVSSKTSRRGSMTRMGGIHPTSLRTRDSVVVRASADGKKLNGRSTHRVRATKAPPGSALDAAQAFSNLVLDSKKFVADAENAMIDLGPRAGVVSAGVLIHSAKSGGRDAGALEGAMASAMAEGKDFSHVVDKAKANLASMWAQKVEGRVSVELGWQLANDAEGTVMKAREMVALCDETRTPRDKLLFKIPATYAGIKACKTLEAEGVPCHLSHVYCREQAYAAVDAGVSVVQLYYSRLNAWYKAKGSSSDDVDPAYDLVRDTLARVKATGSKTKVMVASLANVDAVMRVLGVDYCLVGQRIIDELAEMPASDLGETIISDARASPGAGGAAANLSEADFLAACAASPAKEELELALKRNAARDADLMNFITQSKAGGGNA
ncbi:transaldolase ToTAL2 [Ostreococcus tauri]|uniref:Transaldolase ToTAL2 n=2 Tax=Ostreococcus tauri TaxID=70448 RepID=A0A1Y5I7D2_OSTTA|nr:transaldolase ToTAL2 [Ostreococcus tauri]